MNTPGNKAAKRGNVPPPGLSETRICAAKESRSTTSPQRPVALILGGADCLKADMEQALALFTPTIIIAVNNAGFDYPGPLDHWVTMHPDKMPEWVKKRRANGYPGAGTLWRPRHRQPGGNLEMRECPSWGGSSGLFAIAVCRLGLKGPGTEYRAVLAGVPMQAERAHYDNPKPWNDCQHYLSSWKTHLPQINGKVKSMSGWTREILGAPDQGWLNGIR